MPHPAGHCILLGLLLCGAPALAQGPAPAGGPRVTAPQKSPANAFTIAPWASLEPAGGSLIRDRRQFDLTDRDEQSFVTVFGPRKRPDVRPPPQEEGFMPLENAAATPANIPEVPPTHCSNMAYDTVGGQAGTGQDMIGLLGGGRC